MEEAQAALQRLLACTKSIPASIPNALVATRPLAPSPQPCTARIDPEAFIEPEPQVNTCDLNLSQTAPSVLPLVISRQEMNGKWHLNTPTIPRNHSKDLDADGGTCENQECKGQPVEASTSHGRIVARPACATTQGAGRSNWGRSEGGPPHSSNKLNDPEVAPAAEHPEVTTQQQARSESNVPRRPHANWSSPRGTAGGDKTENTLTAPGSASEPAAANLDEPPIQGMAKAALASSPGAAPATMRSADTPPMGEKQEFMNQEGQTVDL